MTLMIKKNHTWMHYSYNWFYGSQPEGKAGKA